MKKYVLIDCKIKKFKKKITVSADKSLSIRWVLMAAQAVGKSIAYNLLNSDDVNNALNAVKKLGVKVIRKKNLCQINGVGLNGFSLKNNTIIDAGNSGTLARLIIGLLANSNKKIVPLNGSHQQAPHVSYDIYVNGMRNFLKTTLLTVKKFTILW